MIEKDFSAINYYTESYAFSKWVNELEINYLNTRNSVEDKNSAFNMHKAEVMEKIITDNLKTAIASYSKNSSMSFELPIFTQEDWDKIFSNVSMTAFVQNMPIGLKNYNNYEIAVSSNNKEYFNPEEICYITDNDKYFHLKDCDKIVTDLERKPVGYKNIDFVVQFIDGKIENEDGGVENITKHYFKHAKSADIANERCYYCMVSRGINRKEDEDDYDYDIPYVHALARERYVQQKKLF